MKKIYMGLIFTLLAAGSITAHAETWQVYDSYGCSAIWTKSSGTPPTEYFNVHGGDQCPGYGTAIVYTSANNIITAVLDSTAPTSKSYSSIYIGTKTTGRISGTMLSVRTDQPETGFKKTWFAIVGPGEDKK